MPVSGIISELVSPSPRRFCSPGFDLQIRLTLSSVNMSSSSASQQLAEVLHTEIPEERIARVLSDAMAATMTTRAGTVEPDHKTRVQAATLTLAYKVGRPVERQEVITKDVTTSVDEDLAGRLKRSPALRRMFRRILDEAGDGATC
jgi:hypothetical protein